MELYIEVLSSFFSDLFAAFLEAALTPSEATIQSLEQIAEHCCEFLEVKLRKIDPGHSRIEDDLPRELIKLVYAAERDLLIVQVEAIEAQRPSWQAVRRLQESQRRCNRVKIILAELDV